MGHHLTCFLGRPEVLKHLAVPRLRLLALPQGLFMAPMPESLVRELIGERDMQDEDLIRELAEGAAHAGPIGWLMSDWFGSGGSTEVGYWEAGRPKPVSQDEMLAALGVVRVMPQPEGSAFMQFLFRLFRVVNKPLDEWDSLGLGYWRTSERAYEAATPVERCLSTNST